MALWDIKTNNYDRLLSFGHEKVTINTAWQQTKHKDIFFSLYLVIVYFSHIN